MYFKVPSMFTHVGNTVNQAKKHTQHCIVMYELKQIQQTQLSILFKKREVT